MIVAPVVVDLAGDHRITARLIAQPYEWRVRAVERLEVSTALSCMRRRSLQAAPLRQLLGDLLPPGRTNMAALVLPVATLPKGPVLDFDLKGPADTPAFLLPRREIAEREASYIAQLAGEAGIPLNTVSNEVITAILEFTAGPWRPFLEKDRGHGGDKFLKDYLEKGIGCDLTQSLVSEWALVASQASAILRRHTQEEIDAESAADNAVLVVPPLFQRGVVQAPEDVLPVLHHLLTFVKQAESSAGESEEPTTASDLLLVLADYGRRFEVLAQCTVPLDEPFIMRMSERRAVSISRWRMRATQELVIADARTNHVSLRLTDANVQLRRPQFRDVDGLKIDDFLEAGGRRTSELFAFYASDPVRDYRIVLDFGLGLALPVRAVSYVMSSLLILALIVLLAVRPLGVRDLAVLVAPTTLAASLLLVREPSTLSTRLKRTSTAVILAGLLALWITAATLYLLGSIDGHPHR